MDKLRAFEDLPEEVLVRILGEPTLGGKVDPVCKTVKRIREDNWVWDRRADELGMKKRCVEDISTKARVRAELDWNQGQVFDRALEARLDPTSYCATGGSRTAYASEDLEGEWEAGCFDHLSREEWAELELEDFCSLIDGEYYLAEEDQTLRIVGLEGREVVKELSRPIDWMLEEGKDPIIEVSGGLIYEARGHRVRVWSLDGSGQRDLVGREGLTISSVERAGECLAVNYRGGHTSLFVKDKRVDLKWTVKEQIPYSCFVGSHFCRFSPQLGLQAYTQEGKLVRHSKEPVWRAHRLLGDAGAVTQSKDGKLHLILEREGRLKREALKLDLPEGEELTGAARPRPGLLLLGFDSGRLVLMRWDNKRVVDTKVLEEGAVWEFHQGEDKRVLVECQEGTLSFFFANPLDYS